MSKTKKKKTRTRVTRVEGATLADERIQTEKKFNPMARTLLLLDLVFLAVLQLLFKNNLIPETVVNVGTLAGAALMFVGISLQFGKNNDNPTGRPM